MRLKINHFPIPPDGWDWGYFHSLGQEDRHLLPLLLMFCNLQLYLSSLKLNQKISIFQKLEADLFCLRTLLTKPAITYRVSKKRYYGFLKQ